MLLVRVYLVHHADAVGAEVDPQRPLSPMGAASAARTAARVASLGARPDIVWHSGKLRARQTAEHYWRACNALAEFSATRDMQPDDPPLWMADRLRGETRDIMVVGHYPHLPRLLGTLLNDAVGTWRMPQHGAVALESEEGVTWTELWRVDAC
jgi:phosphohistidine phosphatase